METNDKHWLINAGLVTSSIIAITANSFLLLIFCRRRSLRTVPNRFVINLLITNLLSSILLIPFLIADQGFQIDSYNNTTLPVTNDSQEVIIHEEIFDTNIRINNTNVTIIETSFERFVGHNSDNQRTTTNGSSAATTLCLAAQSTTNFVCTLSILSILLIGINQYFGVLHSLHYHFYINKSRSILFIITIWLVAIVFSCLSIITKSGNTLWYFCYQQHSIVKQSKLLEFFNILYIFLYFIIIIMTPFVAICIIYLCIYKAAHKNSERMRKSTSTTFEQHQEIVDKSDSIVDLSNLEQQQQQQHQQQQQQQGVKHFITTLRHKLSNASMFRYREETRAAKISILVIFLVLICYLPYGIILILNSIMINIKLPNLLNILSLILLVFSNILSPFLFAYRNKRVKREILKIFGCYQQLPQQLPQLPQQQNKTPQLTTRLDNDQIEPFLIPEVIVTCRIENEKKSILKRVCDTTTQWTTKKCNFIQVPTSCLNTDTRGSFSSASTQISNDD